MASDELTDIITSTILHVPVACIVSRATTTEIVAVNDAAVELFGYQSRGEMLALDVAAITAAGDRPALDANYSVVFADGLMKIKRYRCADGTEFTGQLFAQPMAGHTDIAIAVVVDLDQSDRLRAATTNDT